MDPLDLNKGIAEEFWSRPEGETSGDADPGETYRAVGIALSSWESTEMSFANIFAWLAESHSGAAARAYGAIMSNSGRRGLIGAAAPIFFDRYKVKTGTQDEFARLMDHFARASGRRDDIAHGIVSHITLNQKVRGAFLMPPSYNTGRTKPLLLGDIGKPPKEEFDVFRVKYRYTSADIFLFVEKFGALRASANLLLADLWQYSAAKQQE